MAVLHAGLLDLEEAWANAKLTSFNGDEATLEIRTDAFCAVLTVAADRIEVDWDKERFPENGDTVKVRLR